MKKLFAVSKARGKIIYEKTHKAHNNDRPHKTYKFEAGSYVDYYIDKKFMKKMR